MCESVIDAVLKPGHAVVELQNAAVTCRMTSCSVYCKCRAAICFVLEAQQQRLTSQNMPK